MGGFVADVEQAQQMIFGVVAAKGQHRVLHLQQVELTGFQGGLVFAPVQQPSPGIQQRFAVAVLVAYRPVQMAVGHR